MEEARVAVPIDEREEEMKRLEALRYRTWEHSRTFTRKNKLTRERELGLKRAELFNSEANMQKKNPTYRDPDLQAWRERLAAIYMPYAGPEAWPLWELAEKQSEECVRKSNEGDALWFEKQEKASRIWDVRCDAGPDDPVERAGGEVVVQCLDDVFPLMAPRHAYSYEGVGTMEAKVARRPESRFQRKERYKRVLRELTAPRLQKSARSGLPATRIGGIRAVTAPVLAMPGLGDVEKPGIYRVLAYGKYERCHKIIRDERGLSRRQLTQITETQYSETRWFEPD
jgi:hypothetical protein